MCMPAQIVSYLLASLMCVRKPLCAYILFYFTYIYAYLQVEGLGMPQVNPDGSPAPPVSPTSASLKTRVALVVEVSHFICTYLYSTYAHL